LAAEAALERWRFVGLALGVTPGGLSTAPSCLLEASWWVRHRGKGAVEQGGGERKGWVCPGRKEGLSAVTRAACAELLSRP